MQSIKFDNFSCYYKSKKQYITILDKLTFEINGGEFFVVVGESGCGKTTLLKSILGLMDYVDGDLHIDGVAIDDFDIKSANIGYVKQEIALYPHLTVYENIAFPLRTMHTPQAEVDKRVKEIAKLLDIDWLLTRKPKQLSGGQHQRIAIARAMVKNPQVVLFDEPFSNIDSSLRGEMRQLVRRIHETYHITTIFVTHDLDEAFILADRIMVLNKGRLEDIGTPEELRQNCRSELLKGYIE